MADKKTKEELRSKMRWGMVGIFALLFVAFAYDVPLVLNKGIDAVNNTLYLGLPRVPDKPFQLGLDLQGGAHLVYHADVQNIPFSEQPAAVEGVRDVIERRVNGFGVGEPNVQTTKVGSEYRVIVELPGVTDVNTAIHMIGGTPILEFKEQNKEPARELTKEEEQQIKDQNAEAKKKATEALNRYTKGERFEDIAKEVSEDDGSKNNGGYVGFVSQKVLPPEITAWVTTAKENAVVSKPIEVERGFFVLKKGKEQEGELQVNAQHILICFVGSKECTSGISKQEAKQKADELFDKATAENFTELVKNNSTEPGASETGGLLNSVGRGETVPEFENALFQAEVGTIVGPVETEFGYHVIYKIEEKPETEYEFWQMAFVKQNASDILPPQDPWKSTELSGKNLKRAEVVSNGQTGAVEVSLNFDDAGTELFKQITERNVGQPVAIFLDGQPISIPVVQQAIVSGQAVIQGSFNLNDARLLTQRLNAGALPVPVELISQQSVGASLGKLSLEQSLLAALVGIGLVMLFMVIVYRLPGVLSVISLFLYATVTLAIFKFIGVTITLAGVAGFVLSVGMAVDANVLIFERMKEELKAGKRLSTAIEDGFLRAWSSIRDGNLSTLITCALLLWFGSSFVQGFAVTLAIGILVSMFTAITITRTMLRFIEEWITTERGLWFFLKKSQKNNPVL